MGVKTEKNRRAAVYLLKYTLKSDKDTAIRQLIEVFARDFPRRNHIIVVDMATGSDRVDEMLFQEINEKRLDLALPEEWQEL